MIKIFFFLFSLFLLLIDFSIYWLKRLRVSQEVFTIYCASALVRFQIGWRVHDTEILFIVINFSINLAWSGVSTSISIKPSCWRDVLGSLRQQSQQFKAKYICLLP